MTEFLFQEMLYLSDGNPGAIDVLGNLFKNYKSQISSILTLLKINNIRGSDIWVIYKLCNNNIDNFIEYPFNTYKPTLVF